MIDVVVLEQNNEVATNVAAPTEENPLVEIWDKLLEIQRALESLNAEHQLDDDLFEWIANFTISRLEFRRIAKRGGIIQGG